MSFSVWPITFRQNRWLTFPDTPVGSDFASGRWVAMMRITPNAGPILTMNSASADACLPCSSSVNTFCASSRMSTSGHSFMDRRGDLPGHPLAGAQLAGQILQPGGAASHFGFERGEHAGGLADRGGVNAGDER